ncbi:hypothetical protein CYMTET_28467 [Cymbomonas tetramitiformis]|uniref:Uncharacterized protein n=1 Tax=Cymbomonas tetramitiformis TaxID=36881 RepID=A0AAE0FMR8_9CHLO|nr:hypothetical protein CYMTET_28467 [Cymbomonas tetramitiformis]|eukprot:gene7544-8982_t
MNGEYLLSQTPNANRTKELFPAQYRDYPNGVEYFDLYSPPIVSLYSQVFWKGLPPVPLPADVVERYAGKGMAVVGFEMDQVRRTATGDVSVPISVAYNHHFESTMVGSKARLQRMDVDELNGEEKAHFLSMGHGLPKDVWVARNLKAGNAIPTSQSFGGANGGEYRKSFHGYAPGFAQIIDSPTQFQITPMQIDTWNRDKMNLTGPTKFVPGPVPRSSLAPTHGADALYSGLLECPVTTRIRKVIDSAYVSRMTGSCEHSLQSAAECFEAVKAIFGTDNVTDDSGSDASKPPGCSVTRQAALLNVNVYFNMLQSSSLPNCGQNISRTAAQVTPSLVEVKVTLDFHQEVAKIELEGPASVWFGVGFNATAMSDAPWTIVVDGFGKVTERRLGVHVAGEPLPASLTLVSNIVAGDRRKLEVTRPFAGATKKHYTFSPSLDRLDIIQAIGGGSEFAYHTQKSAASLLFAPVGNPGASGACICAKTSAPFGSAKGKLTYQPVQQPGEAGKADVINFDNNCAPQPRTDLLHMQNPTCDIRTYAGGQIACHHMWSLLDADQEIPWVDQPLEYHLKFRFWVQPYNPAYHTYVKRTTWGIASPVEYDVPRCHANIEGCAQSDDGNWVHTITGTFKGGGHLVAAHFHCHAPTCLSVALYKCGSSTDACNSKTGTLLCRENPVYGGEGKVDNKNMDEPGFILQPPCLWGAPEQGLEPPPDVDGIFLHAVKTANATYGHHGEMAWLQMYYY